MSTKTQDTQMTGSQESLLNRRFLLIWQGQLISQLGSRAFSVAVLFWSMEATGSATDLGLLMTARSLPTILLGPFAGAFADRHSRLRIIITCDLARGAAMAFLAFWFQFGQADTLLPVLFLLTVVDSTLTSFFNPSVSALIPELVPTSRLAAANSLQQFAMQASTLVGQGTGGLLYRALGAPLLFFVNALSFVFSAISAAFAQSPSRPAVAQPIVRTERAPFLTSAVAGMRYVHQRPGMGVFLLAASILNLWIMPVVVLLPFYVADYLAAGADWYGFLLAALSAGSILGYAGAATIRTSGSKRGWLIVSFMGAVALGLVALGLTNARWVAWFLMLANGVFTGVVNVLVVTLLQQSTPETFRGRVMGIYATLCEALTPVGMLLGGIVGDATGRNIPLVYGACGLLAGLTVVTVAARHDSRSFVSSS